MIQRRMTLRGEFDPRRRSLRLVNKEASFLACGYCKNHLSLAVWAILKRKRAPNMAFNFNMKDTRHPINQLCLPLEETYEL